MEASPEPRIIAGRYELQSLIGEGGMASVWRARDMTLERAVAVKLLFARDERDKDNLVRQFLREARIAASVQHRNVIHIVDFGSTEQQLPYMVMELLEGESLGRRMQKKPPLALDELARIAGLTLRGLAAVHDAGIIHRDLKPENIFLTRDQGGTTFPKILDFGISRSVEPRSGRRSALTTKEGIIVGTPEYMSPEQARGIKAIDHRTDIYSIGVILYEALTGRLPFISENVGDLIIQIVTGSAPSVHALNPRVSRAVSDVIAKAMAREPSSRYPDAIAMQLALLAATDESTSIALRRSLSDLPPVPPPAGELSGPRPSGDRLRTLEFSLDDSGAPPALDDPDSPTEEIVSPWAPEAPDAKTPALAVGPPTDRLQRDLVVGPARRRVWVGVAVALTLGAIGWFVAGGEPAAQGSLQAAQDGGDRANEHAALAARAPADTAPTEPPAEPEPLPTTITVTLVGVPAKAHVAVDGERVQGDEIELERNGRNRVISVRADGFAPWQAVHHASADARYEVLLVKAPEPRKRTTQGTTRTKRVRDKPPSVLRKLDF